MKIIAILLLLASVARAEDRPPESAGVTLPHLDDEAPKVDKRLLFDSSARQIPPIHKPMRPGRKAAFIASAVGAALAALGGVAFAAPGPSGCHDEACWLPQLTAGSTMMGIGGTTALIGLIAGVAQR